MARVTAAVAPTWKQTCGRPGSSNTWSVGMRSKMLRATLTAAAWRAAASGSSIAVAGDSDAPLTCGWTVVGAERRANAGAGDLTERQRTRLMDMPGWLGSPAVSSRSEAGPGLQHLGWGGLEGRGGVVGYQVSQDKLSVSIECRGGA